MIACIVRTTTYRQNKFTYFSVPKPSKVFLKICRNLYKLKPFGCKGLPRFFQLSIYEDAIAFSETSMSLGFKLCSNSTK